LAFIEPSFPRLAWLRRVGNKHQLSGIEKVKITAVRLDEAAFVCLQLGLALPPASLAKTLTGFIGQLESRANSQPRMMVIPSIT